MIYTNLSNFFLSEEELENSPSRRDGIDRGTETTLRIYGCELIAEGGQLLGFPQAAIATGQVLLHRFYCKKSMKDFNIKKLAATALWLGSKLEEVPEVSQHPENLLRKVLIVMDRICLRREGQKLTIMDKHSKEYQAFKEACIRYEREMLRAFGFITHVEHPHKLALNYCQLMKLDHAHPDMIQAVWSLINDSLRTTLCVRFSSSVIACGIIYYAARRLKIALPEQPPWWLLFGVDEAPMYEVCRAMHELYQAPKAEFIPVYRNILPSKPGTPATPATQHGKGSDGDTEPRLPAGPRPGLGPSPGSLAAAAAAGADLTEPTGSEPPPSERQPAAQPPEQPAEQPAGSPAKEPARSNPLSRGKSPSRSRSRSHSRSRDRTRSRQRSRSRSRSRERDTKRRRLSPDSPRGASSQRDRERDRGDSYRGDSRDGGSYRDGPRDRRGPPPREYDRRPEPPYDDYARRGPPPSQDYDGRGPRDGGRPSSRQRERAQRSPPPPRGRDREEGGGSGGARGNQPERPRSYGKPGSPRESSQDGLAGSHRSPPPAPRGAERSAERSTERGRRETRPAVRTAAEHSLSPAGSPGPPKREAVAVQPGSGGGGGSGRQPPAFGGAGADSLGGGADRGAEKRARDEVQPPAAGVSAADGGELPRKRKHQPIEFTGKGPEKAPQPRRGSGDGGSRPGAHQQQQRLPGLPDAPGGSGGGRDCAAGAKPRFPGPPPDKPAAATGGQRLPPPPAD